MAHLSASPRGFWPPAIGILSALCMAGGGASYVRHERARRTAKVEAPAEAPASAAPEAPPPLAASPPTAPPSGTEDPKAAWGRPAPTCVFEHLKERVIRVGPGLATVTCEGKSYQCVVTLVRDQMGFNCAETPSPHAAGEELSL